MIPFNRDEVLADMDDAPLRAAERALARVDEQAAEIQRLRAERDAAVTLRNEGWTREVAMRSRVSKAETRNAHLSAQNEALKIALRRVPTDAEATR